MDYYSRSLYPRTSSERSSSASALASAGAYSYAHSIRHRGLSPRLPQAQESDLEPGVRDDRPASVEDARGMEPKDAHLQPPVIVRTKSHGGANASPGLPFSQCESPQSLPENPSFSENVLDAVPLTPRSSDREVQDHRTHRDSNDRRNESRLSRESYFSRLPSPDFLAPPLRSSKHNSSFAGIFDFFKISDFAKRSKSVSVEANIRTSTTRPSEDKVYATAAGSLHDANATATTTSSLGFLPSIRLPSLRLSSRTRATSSANSSRSGNSKSSSSSSTRTYASTSSVDSGRTYLLPEIDTSDKFTHRWPKPASLKKLERRGTRPTCAKTVNTFPSTANDEVLDYNSFDVGLGFERFGRWTAHKWWLFLSVLSVLGYSIAALVCVVLTWYQTWEHADVMLVADADVLVLSTLCTCLMLLAALVGLTGTLLNSRPLLAIYAILLWPAFISLLSVGYISYKRATFSLDRKLNMAWSKWYTDAGRAVIQDSLRCCGFSDPTHEAVYGAGLRGGCYPRAGRPGCKGPLLRFERANLASIWRAVFAAAVPLHITNIVVSVLCANHVTRTFGAGLVPRGYRLSVEDVRKDAKRLLERFVTIGSGVKGGRLGERGGGSARMPPLVASTESGFGGRPWREDKMYAHEPEWCPSRRD